MDMQLLAERLEALGNETRLRIYRQVVRAGLGGVSVGTVQSRTGVPRSTLSHHLHKLIGVGLIRQRREGTTLFCVAEYEVMRETLGFLDRECCADQPDTAADAAD
ncbi:MAG: metalloregulator ArsR/SmtB family transcription factor [Pseudomonadota bacterium]